MSQIDKTHAIQEYFLAPRPHLYIKAIVIGSALGLLGLLIAIQTSATGVGLFWAAVGVAWAVFIPIRSKNVRKEEPNEAQYFSIARYGTAKARYEARPSLEQMMAWLKEGLEAAKDASMEKLGLVEEDVTSEEPIATFGPRYDAGIQGFSLKDVLRRKVGDNKYFYSTYHLAVFQFTDRFLGAYQATYNMIKDTRTSERTDEFFYRDVVAVRVDSESSNFTLKSGDKLERSKTFSLAVSSGDRIRVVINDPQLGATDRIESLGDEAVANVRTMLRQYKSVPVPASA